MNSIQILDKYRNKEALAVSLLENAVKNNKFTHAYICTCNDHDWSLQFINDFSKMLLCDSKTGSDNCLSCNVFENGQHPDFRIWQPEKTRSTYIMKILSIHDLTRTSQKKPITSKHQVLVLDMAQYMNIFSSNALLKTLEEPNPYTTIILNIDSVENILETIISRCQTISLIGESKVELDTLSINDIFPKSYIEAIKISKEKQKLNSDELKELIMNTQKTLWSSTKENLDNLTDKIDFLGVLENYLISLEKYANPKLLLENMYSDLYEAKKLFL